MPQRPESVAEWMRFARSDLMAARRSAGPEVMWEKPCFDAQQAAERAIKAVLIHFGIMPPRTHYIDRLIKLLPPQVARPPELLASIQLTEYAVTTRYPGQATPVSEDDYREAVRLAEAVVQWAEGVIGE
jgi:HEPN domain-containing protein